MEENNDIGIAPNHCPVCNEELLVTRLECSACGTEVNGKFALSNLAGIREPHASLIEMFLRTRGNMKEMERDLGLSYPTVRARLDEALSAAGFPKDRSSSEEGWEARFEADLNERIRTRVEESLSSLQTTMDRASQRVDRRAAAADQRKDILDRLERGELNAQEAAAELRQLKKGR